MPALTSSLVLWEIRSFSCTGPLRQSVKKPISSYSAKLLIFSLFFIFCNWYECLNVWLTLNLTYGWTKVSECDKFIDMCAYGLRVCGCIYICFCQLLCTFKCMKGIKCLGSMNLWFLLLFKCLELLIRGKYVCTNIHHHDYYYRTPENMNLVCTHGIWYIFCSCQDP